jgi:thiamine pyrophosphate-dependent acetolactate synthase large subunit-like protein
MAQAMGVKAFRVESPHDLEAAIAEALAHPGPALVDVVSARQELVMPPKIKLLVCLPRPSVPRWRCRWRWRWHCAP